MRKSRTLRFLQAQPCVCGLRAGSAPRSEEEADGGPITTSSKEALALFQQARTSGRRRDRGGRPPTGPGDPEGPEFAMAYAYARVPAEGSRSRARTWTRPSAWPRVSPARSTGSGDRRLPRRQAAKAKQEIDELLKLYPQDKRVHSSPGTITPSFSLI